ncbi:alpha-1,4-glucan--maltose-1-phosphate maltosyltransferase [Undibacterium sp. TJN25]|uniref:alpha-1,4-glucan--maltose-1-phosphate maltosyltransferase n=1 Tax=Undibacterium sp. TJN25 TaxID=3413056 RepID=UPI003BF43B6C
MDIHFHPRIYCVPTAVALSAWFDDVQLQRIASLGFDHLLAAPLGGLHDSALSSNREATLGSLAGRCARHGLRLVTDAGIDRWNISDPVVQANPELFSSVPHIDALPDPRFAQVIPADKWRSLCSEPGKSLLSPRFPESEEQGHVLFVSCLDRLKSLLDSGVQGLVCRVSSDVIDALAWKKMIGQLRPLYAKASFFAWIDVQHNPNTEAAIHQSGFDATFAAPDRDGDAGTLSRRYLDGLWRQKKIAPVISFPDNPFGARLAASVATPLPAMRRSLYLRALHIAVLSGDGMMVPMGFEHGMEEEIAPAFSAQAFVKAFENPLFDLSQELMQGNKQIELQNNSSKENVRLLSLPEDPVALLALAPRTGETGIRLAAINLDLCVTHRLAPQAIRRYAAGMVIENQIWPSRDSGVQADDIVLQPAELRIYQMRQLPAIASTAKSGKRETETAARQPRVVIEAVSPRVDDGRFPAKALAGDVVNIGADIFSDGHEKLAASLLWRTIDKADWAEIPMFSAENDRWQAQLSLERVGRYQFAVEAWRDTFATYRDELDKKVKAGLDVTLELEEGRLLVQKTLQQFGGDTVKSAALQDIVRQLQARPGKKSLPKNEDSIAVLLAEDTARLFRTVGIREFSHRSEVCAIDAERKAAQFASWYELFPRSQSGDVNRHGNFDDVIRRLPAIAAMGFDTLYFPPIHPIGSINRKGKNNSLTPQAGDPGSPYAIGSAEGGHTDIHPQLGTLTDFQRLRIAAAEHGLELALDFAIQCAPDHPWLKQHPEWFAWRPDGSIRYAENPPKKYQDIVNVDFYGDGAVPSLWCALRDAVLFWAAQGIKVFRVDNPHTKPLPFWEWMIGDVRRRHPDAIFLAEAFTRPKPMYRLAKLGFSQSYTYFTWRHTKAEFIDYLTELSTTAPRDFFRPHFFVNTPDINPYFLQHSGRPGFLLRAALAATLSGLWGVYSGFELCEAQAMSGKEEYLDSEKYEIRAWDWNKPGNIVDEITMLNRIRRDNPALHTHLNAEFLPASNDNILFFSKVDLQDGKFTGNVLLIAINLDPYHAHTADIELPLWRFGLTDDASLDVTDLVNEQRFTWTGKHQRIQLDKPEMPFSIWRAHPRGHEYVKT